MGVIFKEVSMARNRTPINKPAVIAAYKAGESVATLSKIHGVSTQRIYRVLREKNVKSAYKNPIASPAPQLVSVTLTSEGRSPMSFSVSQDAAKAIAAMWGA